MEIYALEGHKIRLKEDAESMGYDYDVAILKEALDKGQIEYGKIYEVAYTRVETWNSVVILKGVESLHFNTIFFESAEEQSEEDNKRHPDYPQFNC